MSELATSPSRKEIGSRETLPLRFDFTNVLQTGEAVQSASAALVELRSGDEYPDGLPNAPSVASPYVTVVVAGLRPRERYRLHVTATVSTTKVVDAVLEIECPF